MTLVRGRRRAFLAAFMILTVALLDGDCSYLISSATRPPRLKQQRAAVELAAAGENGSQAPAASNAYRQSAPSASSATAASNAIVARHGAYEAVKNGQTYPLARYRAAAEGLSSLERKRSHFLNALQPAARTFLLHGHHERSEGAGLRSGGSSSASSSSRNKRDRNQFERGGYPDMMEYTHGLSDVEDNIIDESPKSSKNLNYYPYRGKRPFEVPQIECPPADDGIERFACPTPDPVGRFLCIDDHVLCDGYFDCPSGEDEDGKNCLFYKTTKAHLDVLADALLRWARGR